MAPGRKPSADATSRRPSPRKHAAPCRAEVVIPNAKGLHARASALFVKCAERFDVKVRVSREGQTVGGTSIMGLMMLAAGQGQPIVIETRGREARAALNALVALVEAGFDEAT